MLHPSHLIGVFHHLFDLFAEPDLDGFIHQSARHDGQQDGWNQRKPDKRRNQFRAEPGANQPMPALEIGFDQIPGQ